MYGLFAVLYIVCTLIGDENSQEQKAIAKVFLAGRGLAKLHMEVLIYRIYIFAHRNAQASVLSVFELILVHEIT